MGLPEMAGVKKKARDMRGWLVFQDESGVSQRPPLRRTWAPRGETPVIIHSYNWKKISICAAIAYRWDRKRTRLYVQMRSGSYATESLISFLKELKKEILNLVESLKVISMKFWELLMKQNYLVL